MIPDEVDVLLATPAELQRLGQYNEPVFVRSSGDLKQDARAGAAGLVGRHPATIARDRPPASSASRQSTLQVSAHRFSEQFGPIEDTP